MKIPMSAPDLTAAEVAAVARAAAGPQLSSGPLLEEFERRFAGFLGASHAVAVSSGTAALHLAVIAAGVTDGDLVLTSPFSFVASANVILYERAIPVFVDIDEGTLNMDPGMAADAIETLAGRPGTAAARRWLPPAVQGAGGTTLRAVLPVHIFGQAAEMDPILRAARRWELAVVEDACEALGAAYRGRSVGTLGDAAAFAFYPNKQMTTGEGGMLVTDRAEWAALARSLRNQGRDPTDDWLDHSRLGFNYRMTELSAALGGVQLGRVEELLARRTRVASWYTQRLAAVDGIEVPDPNGSAVDRSWFVYVIRLAPHLDRRAVQSALMVQGIPSRAYFTPIHLQPFYKRRFGFHDGLFPVTEAIARSTLALPFFGTMTEDQVEAVCAALRAVVRKPSAQVRP
jgi:perosamine synthetase